MKNSLSDALASQRKTLGLRLQNKDTFSGRYIHGLLEILDMNPNNVPQSILSEFFIVGRLVDNLLDEEGIPAHEMINEIGSISELSDFIDKLNPQQKKEFMEHMLSTIQIMSDYNAHTTVKNRISESIALTKLHVAVLGNSGDIRTVKFLTHFLTAGYMICDLKHFMRDKRESKEAVLSIFELVRSTMLSLIYAGHTREFLMYTYKMIQESMKLK